MTKRRARITWSPDQVRLGLPPISEIVDPCWLDDTVPVTREGWSLVCRFDPPPHEQGNPSTALVHFLVDNAPHERLRPGASLRLFERGTGAYANVEILE